MDAVRSTRSGFGRLFNVFAVMTVAMGTVIVAAPQAQAAAVLSFPNTQYTPGLGWDVVGLDSNNVTAGPNEFAKGVRVCNTGDATATNLVVSWLWDATPTPSAYINIQPGSPSVLNSTNYPALASLAAGACVDAYFNIEVTRNTAAWNTFSRYHVTATADTLGTTTTQNCYNTAVNPGACGTGPYDGYRQIFVEKLISQNRNSVNYIKFMDKTVATTPQDACTSGTAGSGTVYVGRTYYFCLDASTATNGYEQLTTYINLPNTIFNIRSVSSTYTAPVYSGNQIYEDACRWYQNPYSADYWRKNNSADCQGTGKVGGAMQMIFEVYIVARGGPITVTGLIYDFSGSSFHYNSDYGVGPLNILTVTDVGWQGAAALDGPDGTDISWGTAYEADNLGFNLYRKDPAGRVQLNDAIIAGSALSTGPEALMAGKTYHWLVPPGDAPPGSKYWIQAIDLKGESQWYGPIAATGSPGSPARDSSPLLSDLGTANDELAGIALDPRSASLASPTSSADWGASRSAVKVGVDHEGWYAVPLSQLASEGLDVSNPSRLHVYADGVEQAARIRGGSVQFYGLGLDTPWTATHAYWIASGGTEGARIRLAGPSVVRLGQSWFPATAVKQDRSVYFSSLLNGQSSNFFGGVVSSDASTRSIDVVNLARTGPTSLSVSLQGVTTGDHDVAVSFDGQPVGHLRWTGRTLARGTFEAPGLVDGANQVTLASSGSGDFSLTSKISLRYPRKLMADGGPLRFTAAGGTEITIEGFTTPGARVYDVTDPSAPVMAREVVSPDGNGGYAATAAVPGNGRRILYAFDPTTVSAPQAVSRGVGVTSLSRQGADMLIVSSPELIPSLDPLVVMHEDQGLSVAVVNVNGIYDRYGSGEKSPQAMEAFFTDALGRDVPPRYVLLVGDASMDPRGFMGPSGASADLIPTMMVDTSLMETASDAWYSHQDGGASAFALGRLPVRTPEEAQALVAKIVDYEAASDSSSIVVATDASDPEFDFPQEGQNVSALVTGPMDVVTVDRGTAADPRGDLFAAMADGPAVLDYIGHGSVDLWRGGFLTGADAQGLANTSHPTFLVSMTCLNGYFVDPGLDSLGESMLKARGGAVGVWASTGMTDAGPQAQLNRAFMTALYSGDTPYVGDTIRKAEKFVTSPDVLATWTLLGDPAVRVH